MAVHDYFDNDFVHIGRTVGDVQFKKRLSFLSKKQNRAMICFKIIQDFYTNPSVYNYPIDLFNAVADEVVVFSPSVNGKGVGIIGDVFKGRVAVNDVKSQFDKEDVDLEKV